MTPFTYLIGWSHLGKWYYGVRYAKGCHPDDLWTSYFTSSLVVKKMRDECGEPDVVEIRKIFSTPGLARIWEERVITRVGAVRSGSWLNLQNRGSEFNSSGEETRAKISAALQGRPSRARGPMDDATKEKISAAAKGRKCNMTPEQLRARADKISAAKTGKKREPFSAEARKNMSESGKGKVFTDSHKAKISAALKGREFTDEWRANISASLKKREAR